MGEKLPNSFNQTIEHFKNHKDCVLIFVRDTNLKSVSETLRGYKSKNFCTGYLSIKLWFIGVYI